MLREELFNILEKGIVKLIDVFLAKPFTFYTESDLHCQLYHILWDLGLNEGCRVEVDKGSAESVLMHKEYPTKGRYRRRRDRKSEVTKGVKRGHFDLCIWDPVLTEQRAFRAPAGRGEQRTLAAVELSLNEHHKGFDWHVYWDLLKLTDCRNEVERGYILFFLRDYPYEKTCFPRNGFIEKLHEKFGGEKRIPVIYVERLGLEERKGLISRASFQDYPRLDDALGE